MWSFDSLHRSDDLTSIKRAKLETAVSKADTLDMAASAQPLPPSASNYHHSYIPPAPTLSQLEAAGVTSGSYAASVSVSASHGSFSGANFPANLHSGINSIHQHNVHMHGHFPGDLLLMSSCKMF